MKNKNNYKCFSSYILRTPLLPFNFYKMITSERIIDDHSFRDICSNLIVKEALFLASPPLFIEMEKWINGELENTKKEEKLKMSILKYLSRMTSRCTPFGLFAGCSVGKFENETSIILEESSNNMRHTRLDMNYLVSLSQDLIMNKNVRDQLLFYPNTSIYRIGDKLRYIEYKYFNNERKHQIVAVDNSDYIEIVLQKAVSGVLLSDLAKTLIDDDISLEDATNFIEELVSSQILISELEPTVSGSEFMDQILEVLNKLNNVESIINVLNEINKGTHYIDQKIGNDIKEYYKISDLVRQLDTKFESKFLFQADMVLNHKKNTLSTDIIKDLKKGFTLLNKITLPPYETLLDKFKAAFYERYEDREIPLSIALDSEIGVGYVQDQGSGDVNPLIDDLVFPTQLTKNHLKEIKWNRVNAIFQKKLIDSFKENAYSITLNDDDFESFEANWDDLPDTISSIIELVEDKGSLKIKYDGGGGSSSANLLGRFCHGDPKLYEYTKEMIDIEAKINSNKILAEILHLPESRIGNIILRPDFREYEIPYLAKSSKDEEKQLPLSDLMISIKKGRIFLRSKKYNKEVLPRLTNAQNYAFNSSPIYHFLGDMQTQDMRYGVKINIGPFSDDYEFIPRIEYNNLILHCAKWNLKKIHIELLIKYKNNNVELYEAVRMFRERLKIPQYAMLMEGDNELLINFDNLNSVRMLLEIVSQRENFKLVEFLFSESGIVKNEGNYYTNQIIVSFYNEQKLKI